ncbi:MAG: hypothetical protein AAF799_37830 [Myxococcota bacterium]
MTVLGTLSVLLSSALFATPKPAASGPSPTEVEVEVVEKGGATPSRFSFVVPIDGSVSAWVDRGDNGRHCKVGVDSVRAGLRLDLQCNGAAGQSLDVHATRSLKRGSRTRLAAIQRPGGAKRQVFVTLR